MKLLATICVAGLSMASACGGVGTKNSDQRSGHDTNEPTHSVTKQPSSAAVTTTLVGCLRAGAQPGSFTLQVTGDTADRAGKGTSGATADSRPAPAESSTTGAGGDAIRNSPTIGGGATPMTYRVVVASGGENDPQQLVNQQVAVAGVIEDNATTSGSADAATTASGAPTSAPVNGSADGQSHTIRAVSFARIADSCPAQQGR